MLEKLRANMNNSPPDGQLSQALMLRNFDRIMTYKLRQMECHFLGTWGENIETWVGKEGDAIDRSGCLIFVAAGATLAATASAALFAFIGI